MVSFWPVEIGSKLFNHLLVMIELDAVDQWVRVEEDSMMFVSGSEKMGDEAEGGRPYVLQEEVLTASCFPSVTAPNQWSVFLSIVEGAFPSPEATWEGRLQPCCKHSPIENLSVR